MKKSFKVALGGIITAFCVITVLLGNIPMAEYIGPTFAGLFIAWSVIELGAVSSVCVFAAASLLSFLLSGNKEPALMFALFFGYFPILKYALQKKLRLRALRWVIKFIVFNIAVAGAYLLLIYVFGMPLEEMQGFGKWTLYILLSGGNLLMVLNDFCIEKLAKLYELKFQKRVHSAFGLKD